MHLEIDYQWVLVFGDCKADVPALLHLEHLSVFGAILYEYHDDKNRTNPDQQFLRLMEKFATALEMSTDTAGRHGIDMIRVANARKSVAQYLINAMTHIGITKFTNVPGHVVESFKHRQLFICIARDNPDPCLMNE